MSGIDLSGNAVVVVPGEILVYRTGAPNRFPRGALIRNVYRRNSSIVARTFLLQREFPSLKELLAEIQRRGGRATQSTATKVTVGMEEDLVIERVKTAEGTRSLRLLQPDKLIDLLATNYQPPTEQARVLGKSPLDAETIRQRLGDWQRTSGRRAVLTGAASTGYDAVMAREAKQGS